MKAAPADSLDTYTEAECEHCLLAQEQRSAQDKTILRKGGKLAIAVAAGTAAVVFAACRHAGVSRPPRGNVGSIAGLAAQAAAQWDAPSFRARLTEARSTGDQGGLSSALAEVAANNDAYTAQSQVPVTEYASAQDVSIAQVATLAAAPQVTLSGMTTADALLHFGHARGGEKVCALNFASGIDVAGGYRMGSQAQEEDLCRRCPWLYASLMSAKSSGFYPFGPSAGMAKYSDVLWTPNVVVARGGEQSGFDLLPPEQQVAVNMVSAAAPNLAFAQRPEPLDEDALYAAVRNIFITPRAKSPDTDTLILGAWGSGAYGGDPHTMAGLFSRAIKENGVGNLYREVHFAIPTFSTQDLNAQIFKEILQKEGIQFAEVMP